MILSNFSISSGSGLIIKLIVLLWESTQLEGYGLVGIEHKINIFRDQDILLKYTKKIGQITMRTAEERILCNAFPSPSVKPFVFVISSYYASAPKVINPTKNCTNYNKTVLVSSENRCPVYFEMAYFVYLMFVTRVFL